MDIRAKKKRTLSTNIKVFMFYVFFSLSEVSVHERGNFRLFTMVNKTSPNHLEAV